MPRSAQLVDRLVPPVLPVVDCHAVSSPWTVVRASTYSFRGSHSSRRHLTPIPHKRRWPNLDSHPTTLRCSIWDSSDVAARPSTHLREHAATPPQGAHHPLPHRGKYHIGVVLHGHCLQTDEPQGHVSSHISGTIQSLCPNLSSLLSVPVWLFLGRHEQTYLTQKKHWWQTK